MASWRSWEERQPAAWPRSAREGLDLGPAFVADPFPGVRLARQIVEPRYWRETVAALAGGAYSGSTVEFEVDAAEWSSRVLLGVGGQTDAHHVVYGACRPVDAVVARLTTTAPPDGVAYSWELELPSHVEPGRERGEMHRNRTLSDWSSLVGVEWLAPHCSAPPAAFAIGRLRSEAWIARVRPNYDTGELEIHVGWDETAIDPLSCSVVVRCERDGLPLMTREIRPVDLPSRNEGPLDEPRLRPWSERLLTLGLPRGPRRTDWGATLLGPDGRLLDELPVVPRFERVEVAVHVDGATKPSSVSVIGDREDPPDAAVRDEFVEQAVKLEAAAREAAARRRISTVGELRDYLRWRLSCVAGELLIIDHSLLAGAAASALVMPFLRQLDRPIRALTRSVDAAVSADVGPGSPIEARLLPHGSKTVHDRVWMAGETGLLVGGSANTFIPSPERGSSPATTVADLPHADALEWRRRFEQWWGGRRPSPAGA